MILLLLLSFELINIFIIILLLLIILPNHINSIKLNPIAKITIIVIVSFLLFL